MEKHVLISVSPYVHKYYLNEKYKDLPESIVETLRAKLGVIAEKTNCIISIGFYENGELFIEEMQQDPMFYDDIGASLEIKKLQQEEAETFKSIKMWYMIYHTPNGMIMRDVLLLQSEKKTPAEIIEAVVTKHGEEYRQFVQVLLED